MLIAKIPQLDTVYGALRILCAWLCQFIYQFIAAFFQIFLDISKVVVLTEENYRVIYNRVTLFLTIIMVFYITFEFIKYLVQPDVLTDKEKGVGNIGKRVVVVVLLIAFVPNIFTYAWKLQDVIINNNLIPKIIIGNANIDKYKAGNSFSATMFKMFYSYQGDDKEECETGVTCKDIVISNLSSLAQDGEISGLQLGLNAATENSQNETKQALINFDGLTAVLAGGFILYVLVLYSIDIAKRTFQLAYLQLIAPIPIVGYLAPKKDNIFMKWLKQCIATYLDLFIRLILIYLFLLFSAIISKAMLGGQLVNGTENISSNVTLLYVVLILGLLLFLQKAPKLIQELLPKSMTEAGGNFGLKAGERVAPAAARALGATWGATKLGGALIRRGAHAYATNKANGRHSILTKAGREERRQDAEHKRELRRANRLSGAVQAAQKDSAVFDEFNEANSKVGEKRKELYKNKYADKFKDIRDRRAAINSSTTMSDADKRTALAQLKREEDDLKAKHAADQKKLSSQTAEGRRAEAAKRDFQKINKTGGSLSNIIADSNSRIKTAEGNIQRLQMGRARAQTEQEKKLYDKEIDRQNKIISYEKSKIAESRTAMTSMLDSNKREQQVKEVMQRQSRAQEQVLEDKNKHYQGAAGVVASSLAGTAKIMAEGAKSKKLEEINKNVKQGVKNDIADVRAVQKYYDEGGTGWVDRTVQQVEKKMGIPTAYERTVMASRTDEPKIKKFGSQATLADNFTSTVDAAEDRAKTKIREAKTTAAVDSATGKTYIKTGSKDAAGNDEYVTLQAGEKTLADVVKRYDQAVVNAHAHTENEQKRYDDFVAQNRDALTDARIMSQSRDSLSAEDQARYDTINADVSRKNAAMNASNEEQILRHNKDEAAQQERKANAEQTLVERNAARQNEVSVIRALKESTGRTPEEKLAEVKAKGYDGALVEKIWDAMERMRLIREDPAMVEAMETVLGDSEVANVKIFDAFMSGEIVYDNPNDTWDTYDKINNAAKSVSSSKKRAKSALEEKQRALQTSNATAAQKAANDFTSSGNK